MGHSSGSRPRALEFWSVTVWRDEEALQGFVHRLHHVEVMRRMRSHVARSEFVRWGIFGRDVPPAPADAERRLAEALAAAAG